MASKQGLKGKRAERQVRDQLKRIYPSERRGSIHRVPMSGASFLKGDVTDLNDNNYSYEVKNHETLAIPKWWGQTVSQAQSWQVPTLIFTSNHRPFYWTMRKKDFEALAEQTGREEVIKYVKATTRALYKKLSSLEQYQVLEITVKEETLVIVNNELYISMRKDAYAEKST